MGHLTVAKWLLQKALKFTQRVWFLKSRLRAPNSLKLAATVKPPLNFLDQNKDPPRSIPRFKIMIVVRWLSQTGLKFEPPI